MLRIVAVNWQNYEGQGADYCNLLYDMVTRNLEAGTAGSFEVFTDDPTGLHPSIVSRSLPDGLTGWFTKLYLLKSGVFDEGDRVLFFDLDVLITGPLDEIVKYDGDFAILRDAYRPNGWQSAVMAWRAGALSHVWDTYEAAGCPEIPGGDQRWIEQNQDRADILQDLFPEAFVSFKVSDGKIPAKADVVFFHGRPRPHEIKTGWVPDVRKIGGLMKAALRTECNTAIETIHANVRINSARDLPWLDYVPAHDGHAVIVGGGPSAAQFSDEIAWRQTIGQTVIALNGSLRWLIDKGITADKFVMVDARHENVRRLGGCPLGVQYLLASQCDPDVFKLVGRHRAITVWHSNAPGAGDHLPDNGKPAHMIGGGSTVGLSAMVLAYVLGYRKIHLYGYDSSLQDDAHHAYDQPQNDGDIIVDVDAGGRRFRAAPWMVQQAQEFVELARWLAEEDCIITVHGDGLLPHMAHAMAQAPISAAQQRAEAVLARLPPGDVRGAEIGVFTGKMSRCLLQREDLLLTMVDSWKGGGESYEGDSGDFHATLTQDKQDAYYLKAKEAVKFAGSRAHILRMSSREAAIGQVNGSLDFVFIDADHSYEGVVSDIEAWLPKLKPGGLLAGHDYDNPDFPKFGVKRAVDEFCVRTGLTLDLGDNFCWFVRLPAVAASKAA